MAPSFEKEGSNSDPLESSNFYTRLGLNEGATRKDIEEAFRGLMQKYHPDRGGTTRQAQLLGEAYSALKAEVPVAPTSESEALSEHEKKRIKEYVLFEAAHGPDTFENYYIDSLRNRARTKYLRELIASDSDVRTLILKGALAQARCGSFEYRNFMTHWERLRFERRDFDSSQELREEIIDKIEQNIKKYGAGWRETKELLDGWSLHVKGVDLKQIALAPGIIEAARNKTMLNDSQKARENEKMGWEMVGVEFDI